MTSLMMLQTGPVPELEVEVGVGVTWAEVVDEGVELVVGVIVAWFSLMVCC